MGDAPRARRHHPDTGLNMPQGYARWFQAAWRRAGRQADSCAACLHGDCQNADHFDGFHAHLAAKTVRRAEHPAWGSLHQFADGTVYQADAGSGTHRALETRAEIAAANLVLDHDWHNESVPQPPYLPLRVITKNRRRAA